MNAGDTEVSARARVLPIGVWSAGLTLRQALSTKSLTLQNQIYQSG